MRRYTRWCYKVPYTNGRLSVGRAFRPRVRGDIIEVCWVKDGQEPLINVGMRLDEAMDLSAGLTHLVALEMNKQKSNQQKGARKAARTRRK